MEKDRKITRVIYRKIHESHIIVALFPDKVNERGCYSSYTLVGNYGDDDYNELMINSDRAKPEEYDALRKELERLGYNLATRLKVYRGRMAGKWKEVANAQ